MAELRAPLHLGGPLGAIGLGCVGGAVALAMAAINNNPAGDAPGGAAEAVLTVDLPPSAAAAEEIAGPMSLPADAPAGGLPPLPGPDGRPVQIAQAQGAPAQVVERPARAEGTEVHFIVRLKGAPEIDTITRNFKRDPAAAQAAWDELVIRVPAMAEFALVGASYSGEIKLAYQMPPGAPASPEDIRSVQDRLLNVEGVSYADPDYIAHPGKDTPP
jgi:hypothetical protein